jgi:hypothetical protein
MTRARSRAASGKGKALGEVGPAQPEDDRSSLEPEAEPQSVVPTRSQELGLVHKVGNAMLAQPVGRVDHMAGHGLTTGDQQQRPFLVGPSPKAALFSSA